MADRGRYLSANKWYFSKERKMEEIRRSPMENAPILSANNKVKKQPKDATNNYDYTKIADWANYDTCTFVQ